MLLTLIANIEYAAGVVLPQPPPMTIGGGGASFNQKRYPLPKQPEIKIIKNDDDEVFLIIKTFLQCK